MHRSQKEQLVAEFQEIFNGAVSGVLVDFQGTTVESLTELRKKLNESGAKFRVLKNTLAKIAAKDTAYEELSKEFVHNRALVYSTEDPVAHAKVMNDFAKDHEQLKIVAGLLVTNEQGKFLDAKGVEALAKLPSREELLVKLLYLFNAPATNFARTLNEVPGKFVRTLAAIADSKK